MMRYLFISFLISNAFITFVSSTSQEGAYKQKLIDLGKQLNRIELQLNTSVNQILQKFDTNNQRIQNSIKSFRDLNKEHASFIWYQLLIEIFLRMDRMDMAKEEMINECLVQYEYDQIELTKIEDFKNNYMLTKAIWWYTRDSFVYRLLNRSLRTENIDQIFKFRFFIKELYKQLKCESVKYKEQLIEYEIETFSVYRGQNITGIELEHLRKNISSISMNDPFDERKQHPNVRIRPLIHHRVIPMIKIEIYQSKTVKSKGINRN